MSGGKNTKMVEVRLRCTECGRTSRIWRRDSVRKGRIGIYWCNGCQERTAQVEVKDI